MNISHEKSSPERLLCFVFNYFNKSEFVNRSYYYHDDSPDWNAQILISVTTQSFSSVG